MWAYTRAVKTFMGGFLTTGFYGIHRKYLEYKIALLAKQYGCFTDPLEI